MINRLGCGFKAVDIRADTRSGENEKRRIMLIDKFQCICAIDRQATIANFEKIWNGPSRGG
jgi:hypothetical protein